LLLWQSVRFACVKVVVVLEWMELAQGVISL
jgi:hypothetical protein